MALKSLGDYLREQPIPLGSFIQESLDSDSPYLNEGLRDIINSIKKKFKQAIQWFAGLFAARLNPKQPYWCPVNEDGEVMEAITGLTAGQALKDGLIDSSNTWVRLPASGAREVGLRSDPKDAMKMYGPGNSIDYWMEAGLDKPVRESAYDASEDFINEVKMHTEDPEALYNVVDTPELQQEIEMCFKNKNLARLLIWGAPGIGKTAIIQSVLDSLPANKNKEYTLVTKTLSNETPDNFTLPKYIEVNGQEKATDIPKTWLPVYKPTGIREKDQVLDDACGKGLLFIDELSRATPQVLNVILPLVNEGEFNGYKLGSGWVIIVASNRAEDELSGQSNIGNALSNRFRQVYYEPTVNSWRKWADTQSYISPLLLDWLEMPETETLSGGKYFYMDPNEDMESAGTTRMMCTPRAWTNAMRQLACYAETGRLEGYSILDIPKGILARTLNMYVPKQAVDSFLAFLSIISAVGNMDEQIEGIWKNGGKKFNVDPKNLRLIAIPLSQIVITSRAKKLPTETEFANLVNWLIKMDSDQLCSYVIDVMRFTYMGDIESVGGDSALTSKLRAFLFNGKHHYDALLAKGDTARAAKCDSTYAPFLSKWKLNSCADMPDYYPAFMKLGKKYGAAFELKVDGVDALG